MASPSTSTDEFENRASRISDPTLDFKAKYAAVCEFREMLDAVRDTEASRILPQIIPAILELLRSGQLTTSKESTEYQFRRGLLDILQRVPYTNDAVRTQAGQISTCMLYLLKHDNEENGVICAKIILDILRVRLMSEAHLNEFTVLFKDAFSNMPALVKNLLSEDSAPLDTSQASPSSQSFKTLAEMGLIMSVIIQMHRMVNTPNIQAALPSAMEFLALESPAQKKAREDTEAMGTLWSGMAPTIKNTAAYMDFMSAQIKIVSFMTYILRGLGEPGEVYGEPLTLTALRIMQDLPANNVALRRDLMVVFRHLMTSSHRQALSPHIDKMYNERVVLGTGLTIISSRLKLLSSSSANIFSAIADFVHHMRSELNADQLARVVQVYARLIQNPTVSNTLHTLYTKMTFNLLESILTKLTAQAAAKLLLAIFQVCVSRVEALAIALQQVTARLEKTRAGQTDAVDAILIEKARPIGGAMYAVEKPEEVLIDSKLIFRTMLHGFRVTLTSLKKCNEGRADVDGLLLRRLFDCCIQCMAHFDTDARIDETNGINEWFALVLLEINLHSFQEVWTHKIDMFFERARRRHNLLNICQVLFTREACSPTLLAIVLDYLLARLPTLGELDDSSAAATLRLYKMAFSAVANFPVPNEPILASHIGKLLMECFPLAAKATKSSHYFHLLRTLFRAIGSGGGRFELLYKEVLPLLPEMLENLNRHLHTTEGVSRELIVELCLTVPLRLTHLLPHLTYLMKPLVLALRGTPELVSQGLRTLELCIDNLNADFLDPTLNTVLRELMDAIHQLLKPLPSNHVHSHTAVRILGKLGGRNRRLLTKDISLEYNEVLSSPAFPISLGGFPTTLDVAPPTELALRTLKSGSLPDRTNAYQYMESSVIFLLNETDLSKGGLSTLSKCFLGIFEAIHVEELESQAVELIHKITQTVFKLETTNRPTREPRRNLVVETFLDTLCQVLTQDRMERFEKSKTVVHTLIKAHISISPTENRLSVENVTLLRRMSMKFSALCLEDSWVTKRAGCHGIHMMINNPDFGVQWMLDRVLELVRTLLHVLKDVAPDLPHNTDEVLNILKRVLTITDAEMKKENHPNAHHLVFALSGLFFSGLSNPNHIVRTAAQSCLSLMVELSGKSAHELLLPHRERALQSIYNKPLRALPLSIQIGMIEAVRFCISLEPPLVEANEELLRLLHESLALADAEDASLLGRNNARQSASEVNKLRVACIKLLTSSMPLTDFFARQPQTRQRVTGVYFKSLYSTAPDVKNVAHDGLRMVLVHQNRLPKELLQTGLRPILMNLADPKRLSVPGLEGLARLLELLTSYFKVEIGHKLLDHFRALADPQLLQASARLPMKDNEGIIKLSRLANIFHLLPPSAHMFLADLVNVIVQTEASMQFSGQSPFSEPLGKYLDRYPVDGAAYFLKHLNHSRYLRTLRSMLQCNLAPRLAQELMTRTAFLVSDCLNTPDAKLTMACLELFSDFISIDASWLNSNPLVIESVLEIWRSEPPKTAETATLSSETIHRHDVLLDILMKALDQSPRIDILFDLVSFYDRNLSMDHLHVTNFLYQRVALCEDMVYRRNVLMRFLTWFRDPSATWSQKAHFIRYIITPTLLVQAHRETGKDALLDADFIHRIHRIVWHPITENIGFSETDDMFKIEILHLTTVMVQYYPTLLEEAKKDIIKCALHYANSEDTIVRQTSLLLSARFFVAFPSPQKFVLHSWTSLLRPPPSEGRLALRQEALSTIASIITATETSEVGFPLWAKTTRRLLSEEGLSPLITIYQLIVKQSELFYPVRALFVPHMVNSLSRLGLNTASTTESRLLTLETLQVMFDWEQRATVELRDAMDTDESEGPPKIWTTPLGFRENMVSFLVRLASQVHDPPARAALVPRALSLIKAMMAPTAWSDVTVGLRFFTKSLETNDVSAEGGLPQAIAAAKVVEVIAADQTDSWFITNASVLHRLIRKGLLSEDATLHDALHPIFVRLIHLYPLPKEEEEAAQSEDIGDFHSFIFTSINNGLKNGTSLAGTILMLKSVVDVTPERVESFGSALSKLLGKLARDHLTSTPTSVGYESNVKLLTSLLEICVCTVVHLSAESRKVVISSLCYLGEKSKSPSISRFVLEVASEWVFGRQDTYPTVKEKAQVVSRLIALDSRGDSLSSQYLNTIYRIYSEPSLRRSELTMRLESSFLLGCRAKDATVRERFLELYDNSIQRSLVGRLTFVLGVQSWECLADQNWIYLALHLILGAVNVDIPLLSERKSTNSQGAGALAIRQKVSNLVKPLQRLMFLDVQSAHDCWAAVFSSAWSCLSRREQSDLTLHMITLLSKDYHIKQAHLRPNVIQTLLTGIQSCNPPMLLPPHLIKYLAKTFNAWHVGMEVLSTSLDASRDDEPSVRDYIYDSLAELYAELSESDMFYGLWRRRSLHMETNLAIAFEQNGMWEQACSAYEMAQSRARSALIPFSEPEYCLWEDHWIEAAQKLQHWESLYELGKSEADVSLQLEAAWACKNWTEERDTIESLIAQLPDVATPRYLVFQAFNTLLRTPTTLEKTAEFQKISDESLQLSLRKWASLPSPLSAAHIPLLQHFQQLVELQEAVQIFGSLATTNGQNLEKKSSELKMVMQAWRERLPNKHDDISVWSDLVAWRQNVFHAINKVYVPLIPASQGAGTTSTTSTYGYRGYHETAWIINRFAHVARKHDLLDVCFTQLTKIYTLPNIEISEAFLKLREQARCHYQKPNDLQAGLEVINSTNLMYFSMPQKAEFFTLKGMFYARFGRREEANEAFSHAIQLDISQAKAWAEWGKFHDTLFQDHPTELSHAANALRCYFNAVGSYKNGKCRPLLTRILWLLSVDDATYTIARAFDTYNGDAAFWFWIPLIPQLCSSISLREWKQARHILLNLAKLYPQALFYHLRLTREDMMMLRKLAASRGNVTGPQGDRTKPEHPADQQTNPGGAGGQFSSADAVTRQPAEHIDEVVQILKTAFPLLTVAMETMVEQIQQKFKNSMEEEVYRQMCLLLHEAVAHLVVQVNNTDFNGERTPPMRANAARVAQSFPQGSPIRAECEEELVHAEISLEVYISRLQSWRERFERILDSRPSSQSLDNISHYLTEFQYGKVDEIEVPGQYTEERDNNQNFVKIHKFGPRFEHVRTHGYSWKRFVLQGSDNSRTYFLVQFPLNTIRQWRRDERTAQVLRTWNGTLQRKKESRKRNLSIHVPITVACSHHLRLYQHDSSYISLADILEQHCTENKMTREEPHLQAAKRTRQVMYGFKQTYSRTPKKVEYVALRRELFQEISTKFVPPDILSNYMIRVMATPSDLWRMRKQFTQQLAACSFVSYTLCLPYRQPVHFSLSRSTGLMTMQDLVPSISYGQTPGNSTLNSPIFNATDVVPFRFTPNLQNFVGPTGTEGLLTSALMALGRSLTEPMFDLEQQLALFGRDEINTLANAKNIPRPTDSELYNQVRNLLDGVVKRAECFACKAEREQALHSGSLGTIPVIQTITNLINNATNEVQLAKMGDMYSPWF